MINCPNPSCKTANPEEADVCQVCQSALPHFYLWGVGDLVKTLRPGTLLNQRYVLKRDRIFIDTKPGIVPESLPDLPAFLVPYLHLSAYPLHVPRPYSVMKTPDGDHVLMLESSALTLGEQTGTPPSLLPKLTQSWKDAPPLRQLSWLWQIAQLWEAFSTEQVAATLLSERLLRVDGSIVRLLELSGAAQAQADAQSGLEKAAVPLTQPGLVELGRFWQPLAETAQSAVRAFLKRLCEKLEKQQINAEQLAEQLSQAITACGRDQAVDYQLAVYTDQGPTRKRNEDACYPKNGTSQTFTTGTKQASQLLIVCDGIGGHQGGDVASKLAIATIETHLQSALNTQSADLTATEIMLMIERAICVANDEISARNDQAKRQARDRMGTTLVMALVRGADVYIAHLGDSRAYRISEHSCQQVTLDDDVASRQMRLGGNLYREVLVQPGSGSLIQALGMGSSQTLRPTVQRFVMDQDCAFLLCSDGLSDSDRVEQFWKSVVRPLVVSGSGSADAIAQKLVGIANQYNGHDNVTVGLLSSRVTANSERIVPREVVPGGGVSGEASIGEDETASKPIRRSQRGQTRLVSVSQPPTEPARTRPPGKPPKPSKRGNPLKWVIAGITLLAVAGGGLYAWRQSQQPLASTPERSTDPQATTSQPNRERTAPSPAVPFSIKTGTYARIRSSDGVGIGSAADGVSQFSQLVLYPKPVVAEANSEAGGIPEDVIPGTVPTGSIVQIVEQQATPDQTKWVQIRLCSTPAGSSAPTETDSVGASDAQAATSQPATPGEPMVLPVGATGWVQSEKIVNIAESVKDLKPTQIGNCGG